jgi:hypothetical protein
MGNKRQAIVGKVRITTRKLIIRIGDTYYPDKEYILQRRYLWFFWHNVLRFETNAMAESYLQALINSQNE